MTVERRIASILFADLVGFTTLSEDLDPEDIAELQDRYFALAQDAITCHGGRVEKFIGDAVVGAFGIPRAGDEDAASAVRAALAVVDAVTGLGQALGLAPGLLRLRVGISTGEVVATYGDAARTSWRLTGDVVNTAARLQSAAEPDTVLIGLDTQLAVHRRFWTKPAGSLTLKGKSEPVPAWIVIGSRETPEDTARSPTLGREDDLAVLDDAYTRAAGTLKHVLIIAPPGVGKTRLVEEFTTRHLDAGEMVWTSRVGTGPDSGYRVIAALLRAALGSSGDSTHHSDLATRIADGIPEPRDELAARHTTALLVGGTLDGDPEDLYSSWLAVLDRCAGPHPAIWVVEDLHLAGPDLLAFLAHVAATAPPAGAAGRLVIVTGRPAVLDAVPSGWPGWQVHYLEPLTYVAARQLINGLLGGATLPAGSRDEVLHAAGGNPLFVEELVRSWMLSGVLRRDDQGAWRFSREAGLGRLPSTVHGIYLGQLDALDEHERRLMTTGSVAGRTFPVRAIALLGAFEPAEPLRQLTRWGLLTGPHSGLIDEESYTYRHAVLRDVAYASLPRGDRAALHQSFARWIARTGSFTGVDELVGTHLAAAHDNVPALRANPRTRADLAREAARWLDRAADRLMTSAPQRTVDLLRRALELTPADDEDDLLRRQLAIAEALRRSGALEDAMNTFADAGALAALRSRPLATAALGYEDTLLASRLPRSRWGARGMDLLEAAAEQAEVTRRGELMAALGQARVHGDQPDYGAETLREALDLARAAGDSRVIARALLALRATQIGPKQLPDRLAGTAEIVDCAHAAGDIETEVEGTRLRMIDLLESGDRAGADEARAQAIVLIERLARPSHLWYPPMWRAMGALLSGDAEGEALVEQFRHNGERWGYRDVGQVYRAQMLHLHADRGTVEAALPLLESVRSEFPARWAPLLAYGYARVGRIDDARHELTVHGGNGFASIPRDLSWSYLAALCADAAAEIEDVTAARALLPLLRPWAGQAVVLGSGALCLGATSHFVGLLARTAGIFDEAATMLANAVRMNESLGAHAWADRSRQALRRTVVMSVGRAGG